MKSSSRSRSEVTKTVQKMGPDGKPCSYTVKEITETIDGVTTVTTETVTNQGSLPLPSSKSRLCSSPSDEEFAKEFSSRYKTPSSWIRQEFREKDNSSAPAGHHATGLGHHKSPRVVDQSEMGNKGSKKKQPEPGVSKDKKININDFRKEALQKHNSYRKKHGAEALKLNNDMCDYAQEWAEHMARTGAFTHRTDRKYGENIFYGMNSRGIDPCDAVDQWYAELKNVNFGRLDFSSTTGHFTQVVWKDSRELGIGFAEPRPGEVYVVANYNPPGNVSGHYQANVAPLK